MKSLFNRRLNRAIGTLFLVLAPFLYLSSLGQSVQLSKGDTVLQRAGKKASVEYVIKLNFQLSGKPAGDVQAVLTFKFLRPVPIRFSAGNDPIVPIPVDSQSITISFKSTEFPGSGDPFVKNAEKKITIKLLTENLEDSLLNLAIVAGNVGTASSPVVDCFSCNYGIHLNSSGQASVTTKRASNNVEIYYLNAYNIDFTNSFTSNYLGEFNVFAKQIDNSRWGMNVGFGFINYNVGQSDSTANVFIQKTLVDPLADSITKTQKYLKQLNKYVTKQQNSSKSLYFQPLYLISDPANEGVKIYAHLHIELLINKTTVTTTITNIKQDSISPPSTIPVDSGFFRYEAPSYSSSTTLLNGYFGTGLTLSFKLLDTLHAFFQGTIGYTTNYPNLMTVNTQPKFTPASPPPTSINPYGTNSAPTKITVKPVPTGSTFYYVKGYFDFNLSKSLEALVGAEVRGFFGHFPPYYAVYAGVNLNIQTLFSSILK